MFWNRAIEIKNLFQLEFHSGNKDKTWFTTDRNTYGGSNQISADDTKIWLKRRIGNLSLSTSLLRQTLHTASLIFIV